MTQLVVTYDSEGTIRRWRYEPDDDYQADADELAVSDEEYDHRELEQYMVDVDADPPTLIDDPEYDPRSPIEKRVEELEKATGMDGEGKRGIASRLDDLEDRIATLESHHE